MEEYMKNTACLVTKSLMNGKTKLKWLFREEDEIGSGWTAIGEEDSQEYIDNSQNWAIISLYQLWEIEPSVSNVLEMPIGTELEFISDNTGAYFINMETGEEIREKVKSPFRIAFEKNLEFLKKDEYSDEFLKKLFTPSEKIAILSIGKVDFPSGKITVADPLCYLHDEKYNKALNKTIPKGTYEVETAIYHSSLFGNRIIAAKLKIMDTKIKKYEIAMPEGNSIEQYNEDGIFSGFGVDAGLASFCDAEVAKEYSRFLQKWHHENPNKNHYDDYFADFFAKSYETFPEFQKEGGDFLEWTVPETNHKLVMFESGFGDGYYTSLWGLDEKGEICELIIPFINPDVMEEK